jgi:hypothetical protein
MKDFKVLNFQDAEGTIHGSSLKGYINATYSQLIETLGEPTYDEPSEDDKTHVEWVVEFEGSIFTIYDWKTYSRDYTENELTRFNVGGKSSAIEFFNHIESLIK